MKHQQQKQLATAAIFNLYGTHHTKGTQTHTLIKRNTLILGWSENIKLKSILERNEQREEKKLYSLCKLTAIRLFLPHHRTQSLSKFCLVFFLFLFVYYSLNLDIYFVLFVPGGLIFITLLYVE